MADPLLRRPASSERDRSVDGAIPLTVLRSSDVVATQSVAPLGSSADLRDSSCDVDSSRSRIGGDATKPAGRGACTTGSSSTEDTRRGDRSASARSEDRERRGPRCWRRDRARRRERSTRGCDRSRLRRTRRRSARVSPLTRTRATSRGSPQRVCRHRRRLSLRGVSTMPRARVLCVEARRSRGGAPPRAGRSRSRRRCRARPFSSPVAHPARSHRGRGRRRHAARASARDGSRVGARRPGRRGFSRRRRDVAYAVRRRRRHRRASCRSARCSAPRHAVLPCAGSTRR